MNEPVPPRPVPMWWCGSRTGTSSAAAGPTRRPAST